MYILVVKRDKNDNQTREFRFNCKPGDIAHCCIHNSKIKRLDGMSYKCDNNVVLCRR